MNLADAIVVLRPRTLAEILDLACRLCCSAALSLYLKLSAIVLLPGLFGCFLLRYWLQWEWGWVWLVAAAWASMSQGVFTVGAGRILFAESTTVRQVLSGFRTRFFPYLGALLLSRLALAGGFVFFLIPLPFVWIRMLFVHEASLLEGAGVSDALKRSSRFIRGKGAAVFLVLLSFVLVQASFVTGAELLGDGLIDGVFQLGKPFGTLLDDGGSPMALLGFLLSIPYLATARFLCYIDSRTRTDGWDIQLRFMAIAAQDAAERRALA